MKRARCKRSAWFARNGFVRSNDYMDNPFLWSASVEQILEKVAKCKEPLDALH